MSAHASVAKSKKSKASRAATGPRAWKFDDNGNIVNFSFKALRQDVLARLRNDMLYTLEECKVMVKELLKYATAWLEVELAQLLYLSGLHSKLLPNRANSLAFQWPLSPVPTLPFDFGDDVSSTTHPRYRIGKLVEEVNKSLVRLIDTLLMQRKERLLLAARILEDLDTVEELR